MEYSRTEIRTLSMLGSRGAFGTALTAFAKENEKIVALSADLCNTSGLDRFKNEFPDRFTNTGIAEQNLVGVAAGLADAGFIPFATTFANFATLRSCEFVRHFMGYMKSNVKIVGLGAGYAMEFFGNTHYGVEDVAAVRSIPNLTILSPADGLEIVKCVNAAAEIDGPVYIRLTGVMNAPIIYKENFEFQIGKAIVHQLEGDIAIVATGTILKNALDAAKNLEKSGIRVAVIDMHTIKPLDTEILDKLKDRKAIITVEEHNSQGGLGTSVAEYLSGVGCGVPVIRLGTADAYTKAGSYEYKINEMGLDAQSIENRVRDLYM